MNAFMKLISEHFQVDDSAVEERTPTRVYLLKLQASSSSSSSSSTILVLVLVVVVIVVVVVVYFP